ncbi:hypothetical protein VIN01S_31300 [Vibrio inusitatus NBRC 102082]|uniref:Antitoxin n=1 Tax=Vibrio inusitatus NBRC 102082 TaxID=1219070 RepID=A0A4Y3HYW4_9VIBR|nr:type II toxin-antitoxin system Phd/YefM family antitoxin [Vibrio inusitatus]GEA52326.1 hypothetical protein VIN01S_31300 [Vibrio inusitatus NBRC 102082]
MINDCDSVTIHRRDSENVVMMSESEFNGWKETIHLMSNPKNAARLMDSIAQAEQGLASPRDIVLGEEE